MLMRCPPHRGVFDERRAGINIGGKASVDIAKPPEQSVRVGRTMDPPMPHRRLLAARFQGMRRAPRAGGICDNRRDLEDRNPTLSSRSERFSNP